MKKKVNRAYISIIVFLLTLTGCNSPEKAVKLEFSNPYRPQVWTVAVVPFKNDSGSEDVSSIAMTDEFYTALASVQDNIQVLSVNQVMATQTRLGLTRIKSEEELSRIAEELGADALFVGKITRYQPYYPPLMGIVVQVYQQRVPGQVEKTDGEDFNPSRMTRIGTDLLLEPGVPMKAMVMVNDIFDASHKDVLAQIKRYSARQAKESPLGIDKVMTSSGYMRFVSHQVIGRLLYDYNLKTGHIRD